MDFRAATAKSFGRFNWKLYLALLPDCGATAISLLWGVFPYKRTPGTQQTTGG